jgi:hypothetical protein
MVQRFDLGTWILQRFGPGQRLAGDIREIRLVGFYAQAEVVPDVDRYSYRGENLPWTLGQLKPAPDVLLLWAPEGDREDPPQWQKLLGEHAELGFCLVPPDQLPASCQGVKELVAAVRKGLRERPPDKTPAHAAQR